MYVYIYIHIQNCKNYTLYTVIYYKKECMYIYMYIYIYIHIQIVKTILCILLYITKKNVCLK